MKNQKVISVVLIASMLVPLCGCSGDNKTVLAVADKYAQAVTGFDTDDLADLMVGSNVESSLEQFESVYNGSSKLKPAYDAVFDSITYEIDQKSVQSSKKDKTASVEITYTLVDYEAVYDEVFEDGGTIDDYIKALENNDGEDTIEITQTIEFTYDHDKWLVRDKKNKNINKIYAFLEDISEYAWGNFKEVSPDEFKSAMKDVFKLIDNEITESIYNDSTDIGYVGDDVIILYTKYYDKTDASYSFMDFYANYESDLISAENKGLSVYSHGGEDGYLLLNDVYFSKYEQHFYGGVYLKGDTIIIVIVMADGKTDHTKVDRFLDTIGYPKPY